MTVNELSKKEILELKALHYAGVLDESEGRTPSYGELAIVDDLVSDEEVFEAYSDTFFVKDDFFCNLESEAA